ncbi:uncharacterized protein C2orf42-like [Pollicipes pollicipes]|uniref:uncharacterized protein C2orf42-like n=1 Tax=Pollicipes pollicipes TaxID=41117 RepID=UPI00188526A4|nr:uncharacterized protein C2orf42-like [Pollicipes pollicipes]
MGLHQSMASSPDKDREKKLKSLLSDLGRATMRGVRKCPQCGTLNGTRGNSCKNKSCNVKFREKSTEVKSKSASKLSTGSSQQMLFSVRVRESGPEMRGFVQLPDPVQSLGGDTESPCCHVASCQKSTTQAIPLMLKYSVLSNREDLAGVRHHLWNLATETSGPLVQRVSRCYLVVKCKPTRQFPLGYLHAYFSPTISGKSAATETDQRFFCPCSTFRHSSGHSESRRCIHVYACFCAFLSSETLRHEFEYFVNLDERARLKHNSSVPLLSDLVDATEATDSLPVLDVSAVSAAGDMCEVEVEVLEESAILQAAGLHGLEYSDEPLRVETGDEGGLTLQLHGRPTGELQASTALLTLQQHSRRPAKLPRLTSESESSLTTGFYDWLGGVTERINQTMHFQCDGRPDPLVFHVPHTFFAALKERIAFGVKKRRLPNEVTSFARTDTPPLGTFTKYTWQITNILHVKSIFDGSC